MNSQKISYHKHSAKSAECAACGKVFSSDSGFDRHRRGSHSGRRYCLNSEELIALGYETNRFSRWTKRRRLKASTPGLPIDEVLQAPGGKPIEMWPVQGLADEADSSAEGAK